MGAGVTRSARGTVAIASEAESFDGGGRGSNSAAGGGKGNQSNPPWIVEAQINARGNFN
ncbi:hypothetical protein BEST7613_4881 [Synechocystis sp. PCC 6803]|nr:hypothetical protein BEST7613_4881 [Synechocystis sp. PCC 6803] [Bacillus subtilis BEST7613]